MYAVVNIGGKQAKVEKGSLIAVEKLDAKVGDTVSLPVLMIADGDRVLVKPSELTTAGVTAEVLEHFKGEKQIVFKFKKRKGYKRTKGHRQTLTSVRILDITTDGVPAKVAKPKAEKAAPAKAEKPKAEKAVKPEPKPAKAAPAKAEKPKAEKAAPAKAAPAKAASVKADKPAKPEAKPAAPAKAAPAKAAAAAAQCAAVKSDGTQCANKAKEGSKYCGVHAKLEG
jgi:large subunit ribosomal protein L21